MSVKKKGVVFGYRCQGRDADNNYIFRFGRSTRTKLEELAHFDQDERKKVAIERLGQQFGGLNKPELVIMWEEVSDMNKAWELVRDYLHGHFWVRTETSRPEFKPEARFGDNYFSVDRHGVVGSPTAQVRENLQEMVAIAFRTFSCRE
jgi:hypothetical protein